MNLVKILEPYAKDLHQYMEVNGRISPETLRAIKPIYEEYWTEHRYIGVQTMKLNCSGCVYDCCKALWNTYKQVTNNHTVNFKGIPERVNKPLKPLEAKKIKVQKAKKLNKELEEALDAEMNEYFESKKVIKLSPVTPKEDWDSKTWPEIKEEAKRLNIKIHGKNKKALIAEINSKA